MMLSKFLAKQIYNNSGDTKKVSLPAVRIATLGMAIGLAVMIVSVAVVFGFKHTIRDKVIGFGSHIVVQNFSNIQNDNMMQICVSDSMISVLQKAPDIDHIQRYAIKQGLLKTDTDFLGVVLKGVGKDWDSTFIAENIVDGTIPKFIYSKDSQPTQPQILISKIMADKLGVKANDKLFAYFLSNNDVRMRRFVISGVYCTNLTKYDESIVFCDLNTVQKLNGWDSDEVSGVEMTVKDFSKIDETAEWMIHKVNRTKDSYGNTFASSTIQEINPQIFSWLDLLDLNVWIILALMVCVASVTMISGLLIIILERVPMIGILKALGSRNSVIRHTFLWFGMFIMAKGLIIGNILGIGVCLLQQWTGIVKLDPTTYYVSEVPVELNIPTILLLNAGTFTICTLVLVVPSFLVSHIHPAKTIKFGE
ncbi:ABC transporter permease [Prevotella sp. PINT]|uniref:ABC transporter permease n=1 Tax=Palleniella intestinalis TaxID=2736291 RepID=UPI00155529AB|nr:ABC transporter permease [Palleniella intestinalis]NPD80674.1 ABC transporter permease [Palleniella intestinalis]